MLSFYSPSSKFHRIPRSNNVMVNLLTVTTFLTPCISASETESSLWGVLDFNETSVRSQRPKIFASYRKPRVTLSMLFVAVIAFISAVQQTGSANPVAAPRQVYMSVYICLCICVCLYMSVYIVHSNGDALCSGEVIDVKAGK